ncbi:MAG: sugar transferase [Acidimicrobiales bacterium]|nr:sugar transferase [Acidimicrobiales bacterium]
MTPAGPYRGKRLLDLAILAVVAVPAALIGLVCAGAVRLSSRGPVLFLQERVGMDGTPFVVWKFRTMLDGENPIIPTDDRITAVGRILRRTSLDELPQLVNVARGEMSVVGPRPTLAYQVERWSDRQKGRLAVRPGLTGLAQVNGRNDLSWAERIEFDLEYVRTQSLRRDLAIIARTVAVLIGGEGTGATAADDPLAEVAA